MASDPTPQQWQEIEAHLFAGRKIEAFKLFREATGAGLAEAKTILEAHEAGLRQQFPEKFTAPKKAGCGTAVLMLAAGIAGVIWMWG